MSKHKRLVRKFAALRVCGNLPYWTFVLLLLLGVKRALAQCPLECGESNFNFGAVPMASGEFKHEFILRNGSAETVKFEGLNTSCGCTTASLTPEVIAPNQTAKLTVALNTNHPGSSVQNVTVFFDKGTCQFGISGMFVSGGMISPEVQTIEVEETKIASGELEVIQYLQETSQSMHRLQVTMNHPLFNCNYDENPLLERDPASTGVIRVVTKCRVTSKQPAHLSDNGYHSLQLLTAYYRNGDLTSTESLHFAIQLKVKSKVAAVPPALVLPSTVVKPVVSFRIESTQTTSSVTRITSTIGKPVITSHSKGVTYVELDCSDAPKSSKPLRGSVDVWVNDEQTSSLVVPILILPRTSG